VTEGDAVDFIGPILERKRKAIERRRAHRRGASPAVAVAAEGRGALAEAALRRSRPGWPSVIAEIKLRSPSAGTFRKRERGVVQSIARQYAAGGAAAVSVLCDGPGFGGSVLDLRRAASAVSVPLLFKEFVLDPLQVALAHDVGAHMVLLIVRAMDDERLRRLVAEVQRRGMAPVVEAADEAEVERALSTDARIVGVNARDLRTFGVDAERARRALALIPSDRIAVHMSGIRNADDLASVARTRTDAVLVGEALMRSPEPDVVLRSWLAQAPPG